MSKRLLLTNDDGIYSPGISALRTAVDARWESVMVAPDREQSAASHALTLNRPLRVNELGDDRMSVDGTPTDCVMLSIMGLLDQEIDLVISGVNDGANLGDDVIYSGTVAAAAEAVMLGVPAIAVSCVDPAETDQEWSAVIACMVADAVFRYGLPPGILLNVNIPPVERPKTFEITSLGRRSYRDVITRKTDPRGKPYYWIGGQVEPWKGPESCDFAAIDRGSISVTPLHLDMTAGEAIERMESWRFES